MNTFTIFSNLNFFMLHYLNYLLWGKKLTGFDKKKLSKYDGKITNMNKFLKKLISFQKKNLN